MAKKTATIEAAQWDDGLWNVRVSVVVGTNTYATSHTIEGPEGMTPDDLEKAVLALY